ncbi:hypothetical protein AAG906_038915 [Vitis piasezkii]
MESINASSFMKIGRKTFELLDNLVGRIGEKNVVQVITNNGSNYIFAKYIKKLPTIKRTLTSAITLNGFIYNYVGVINMMREFTKQRELKQVSEIVLMPLFWNHVVYILKVIMGHLVKVLQLVDNERKLAMGYIYEAMDRCLFGIPIAIRSRKTLALATNYEILMKSNEWLIGKISEEDTTIHMKDDLTLSKIKDKFKKGFSGYYFTTDFEEKESNLEDIEEEDDNEMEGYQSSLDGSDDNFNFNNDYNDDA